MQKEILKILKELYNKQIAPENALEQLKFLPYYDINHTKIDTHREFRTSLEEVIFGKSKDVEDLLK